jgi:hypothetical protein
MLLSSEFSPFDKSASIIHVWSRGGSIASIGQSPLTEDAGGRPRILRLSELSSKSDDANLFAKSILDQIIEGHDRRHSQLPKRSLNMTSAL